ncbi:MAG TPA: hypothetical protein VGD67_12710 [Pseudonocardiaceae bacterium]
MRRSLLALVAAVLWAAATAAPASAHVGPLTLRVAGDGATGVTVTAVHADGHPLDAVVRMSLTASGPNGQVVGPLELLPAGEGKGFYNSGPILEPGRWTVRVTAPEPTPGTAEATVDARAGAPPAAPVSPVTTAAEGMSGTTALTWAIIITALTAAVALLAHRRRRT